MISTILLTAAGVAALVGLFLLDRQGLRAGKRSEVARVFPPAPAPLPTFTPAERAELAALNASWDMPPAVLGDHGMTIYPPDDQPKDLS